MPSEWVWVPDDAGAMSTRPMPTWSSARLMPIEVRTWPRQPLDGSCHSCDCDLDGGGQLSISMFELLLRRSVWVASTARTHSATSLRSWPMQLLARIAAARRDVSSRCLACFTGTRPAARRVDLGLRRRGVRLSIVGRRRIAVRRSVVRSRARGVPLVRSGRTSRRRLCRAGRSRAFDHVSSELANAFAWRASLPIGAMRRLALPAVSPGRTRRQSL
jgi:hypothetical protein